MTMEVVSWKYANYQTSFFALGDIIEQAGNSLSYSAEALANMRPRCSPSVIGTPGII